ncbi:MAG TPA: hypothetical protein VG034_03615 [Acidimicrobiia bacterium]|jgi:hypothetical protein|nr:hypothetical protein [Acidimicrobiia bacterium]
MVRATLKVHVEALWREVRRLEAELGQYRATVKKVLRDEDGKLIGLLELGGRR